MGDLREKLDRVNIKDLFAIPQFICAIPFATLLKRKRKDMWLICEDYNEARDNGYWCTAISDKIIKSKMLYMQSIRNQ